MLSVASKKKLWRSIPLVSVVFAHLVYSTMIPRKRAGCYPGGRETKILKVSWDPDATTLPEIKTEWDSELDVSDSESNYSC